MIKNTYKESPTDVLSAYKDNASVIVGYDTMRFIQKRMKMVTLFINIRAKQLIF